MVKPLGIIVIPFDEIISSKLDFIREKYHKNNIWFYQYSDFLTRPERFIIVLRNHYGLGKKILLRMGIVRNLRLFYPNVKDKIDFDYTKAYMDSWKSNTKDMLNKSGFPYKIVYLDSIIKQKGVV